MLKYKCLIEQCKNQGKHQIRLDLSKLSDETLQRALKIHEKYVCDMHMKMFNETYFQGVMKEVSEGHTNN